MKTFEEFIKEQIIWKNTEHFDILIEAVSQIHKYPSTYLKDYGLDKRRISELYKQIFDLSEKNTNNGVNHYFFNKYNEEIDVTYLKIKICNECEEELPINNFYSNGYDYKGKKKFKPKCKLCTDITVKERHQDRIIQFFGKYKCIICGYDKCIEAIDFHHINPLIKENKISNMRTSSIEELYKELKKGVLLCANCHRETHQGLHPKYLKEE